MAKVWRDVPTLKAIVQVDDGHPLVEGALRYEDLVAEHEPAARAELSGDDLYILYTGGTTGMPKGVMWRNEDLYESLVPSVLGLFGVAAPEAPADFGRVAAEVAAAGRTPVHLPASPLMHGTGFMSSLQALCAGGTIVTLESRSFDAHELWRAVGREHVTQMAIVGDAFGKPMVRALEDAEADNAPYDLVVARPRHQLGRDVDGRDQAGADGTRRVHLPRLARLERGRRLRASRSARPAPRPPRPSSRSAPTRRCSPRTGREVAPGSDERGLLALGGPIPLGYYKDPEKSAATFRTFGGKRYSIPGDWAKVAADGTIELLGRGSVSINSGGEKIFPEEVEEAVKKHPAVAGRDRRRRAGREVRRGHHRGRVVPARRVGDHGRDRRHREGEPLARSRRRATWSPVPEVTRGPNGKADYAWAKRIAAEHVA